MENHTLTENLPFVQTKLKIRLIIYFLLAVAIIGIVIFHIISDNVSFVYPLIALVVGTGLGTFVSRIFKITWDHGAGQVISEFDIIGVLILIGYVFFELYREEIVEYFIHGPQVIATSFALLAGIMIGRILGIRTKIVNLLNENL